MRELLLLSFHGVVHGVWRTDVLDLREIDAVHRLPLTPTCIAGMSILDDRTVTLADLSVCLGFPPITRDGAGRILLMSEHEQVTGFLVEGGIKSISLSDEALMPVPEFLQTPVVDRAVVHQGLPIPVINISRLYDRIQKADREPAVAEFSIGAAASPDAATQQPMRIVRSGGETFALAVGGQEALVPIPAGISRLALLPPYAQGIAVHEGRLLSVIHLARAMKLRNSGLGALMLPHALGTDIFGFIVDGDEGVVTESDREIKPLPALARSVWLREAIVRRGEIIPLIDLVRLLSPVSRAEGADQIAPLVETSEFESQFGAQDVDVVEFSLFGARHAVPKCDVVDDAPWLPYRELPDIQSLVVGVALRNGNILPVLDLGLCFGRRSRSTPAWRMLEIQNGNFHAVVATERVYGPRLVTKDMQRSVPIVLPHRVVYGCYPETGGVRLILNVASLSMNFDQRQVRDILGSLAPEIERHEEGVISPAARSYESEAPEIPIKVIEQEVVEQPEAVKAQEEEPAFTGVASLGSPTDDRASAGSSHESPVTSEEPPSTENRQNIGEPEQPGPQLPVTPDADQDEDDSITAPGSVAAIPQEQTTPVAEPEPLSESHASSSDTVSAPATVSEPESPIDAPEATTPEPEPEPTPITEVFSGQKTETMTEASTQDTAKIESEHPNEPANELPETGGRRESSGSIVMPDVGSSPEDRVDQAHPDESQTTRDAMEDAPALRKDERKLESTVQEELRPAAQEHPAAEPPQRDLTEAHESIGEDSTSREPERTVFRNQECAATEAKPDPSASAAPASRSEHPAPIFSAPPVKPREIKKKRSLLGYAAVAAVFIVVLSVFKLIGKPTGTMPDERPGMKSAVKTVEAPTAEAKRTESGRPGPLTLTVPADRALGQDVYLVKKGDTLWAISKRFTGNPLNYPAVASDNRIANPDLIYPGQKVILQKKAP